MTAAFCHGDRFTLADIAAGFALGCLDQVLSDINWRKSSPRLVDLAERLAKRDWFASTLPAS